MQDDHDGLRCDPTRLRGRDGGALRTRPAPAALAPGAGPHRPRRRYSVTVRSALRTEKLSSPENTRYTVFPSPLIHFVGRPHVSPGPTSQDSAKYAVVHGPHGS